LIFARTSDGYKYKNNRYTKRYARKLKKAQQGLSRKIKGSNRYNKQKLKVAKIHEKITNSRKGNLHKVSTELVKKYDTIMVEDLNTKGMVRNHKLAKHISDASWGTFIEMLLYKSSWNDKQVIKVGRFFPSSKKCNKCGYINQNLTLKIRKWQCPICGEIHDRDLNAAKNILEEGLKYTSAGTADHERGTQISPANVGTSDEALKEMMDFPSEAPSFMEG
jgi:putative transposase